MGTIIKIGSVVLYFTSFDCIEPMHIHIADGNKECKFWLKGPNQIDLALNSGFSHDKLLKLQRIIFENYELIKYKWDEICKDNPTKQYRRDRPEGSKNKGKRG